MAEVIVAVGVIMVTLIGLAHSVTVAFSDIGLARQRQGANGLANETIERARALPQDTLRKGLRTSDLNGDPAVVNCSGTYKLDSCSGEQIVHTAGLPAQAPLVPNRTSHTPSESATTYAIALYVTSAGGDPATGPLRLTAIVGWDHPAKGGVDTRVVVETIVYAPKGCVDTATHPFSAPCQPFFYGSASVSKPKISVEGSVNGVDLSLQLDGASARTDAQLEQIKHIQGAISGTGLSIEALTALAAGNESATSRADDDPATPGAGAYDSKPLPGGTASTLNLGVGGVAAQVSRTSGSIGATTSATSAKAGSACPTTTPPGAESDSAACGHNWSRQQEALAAQLSLGALGIGLGNQTIASIAATPDANATIIDRDPAANDGSIVASGTHALGEVRIGGLPTGILAPLGFAGHLVRLTTYRATASAAAGDATSAPSASVVQGQVQFWNGLGYSTANLGGLAPIDLSVAPINLNVNLGLASVQAQLSAEVTTGTVDTVDPDGPGSGARNEAEASVSSPLSVSLHIGLHVSALGSDLLDVDLDATVDLGALTVQADYREADVG